jgi:hypothetical protein
VIVVVPVIVATGVLLAWMLVQVGRLALGEARSRRALSEPVTAQGALPTAGPPQRERPAPDQPGDSRGPEVAPSEEDVERSVRAHLYGTHTRSG